MNNQFVNAQEMAKLHPLTFQAPTPEELSSIKKDDYVKVCRNDERFWTRVVEIEGTTVTALVSNDLLCNPDFPMDKEVYFDFNNIYSTMSI